jgi:short-subunit dehydrogenase
MTSIAGKNVLLTGASGGIGAYVARALAKQGANVICVGRLVAPLDQVVTQIKQQGGQAFSYPFDISQLEELPNFIEQITQTVGKVDILINNAAIEKYSPFQHYYLNDIRSIVTTNLISCMELARLLLPDMISQDSGHIVNISSGSGKKGVAYNSVYSATKAGLINWTDALRQELVGSNVKVTVICPGYTNAGMFLAFGLPAPKMARVSEPTDVANAILRAIEKNYGEVMLDGFLTKLLFAYIQLVPDFGDRLYRWIGLTNLNKTCALSRLENKG